MPRPRDRILENLETIYREAYERARTTGDERRMIDLDSAYQREQLLQEVLLDIRDSLVEIRDALAPRKKAEGADPLAAISTIRKITKLR